ncbi:hypothetical protein [Paenibacillus sp. Soil750]|nr:hypothetical protein [Paenibacillus sp. Soil750]
MATSQTQAMQKAIKGQTDIFYTAWSDMTTARNVEQMKAINPNVNWV